MGESRVALIKGDLAFLVGKRRKGRESIPLLFYSLFLLFNSSKCSACGSDTKMNYGTYHKITWLLQDANTNQQKGKKDETNYSGYNFLLLFQSFLFNPVCKRFECGAIRKQL
jgi:hypothetical protein